MCGLVGLPFGCTNAVGFRGHSPVKAFRACDIALRLVDYSQHPDARCSLPWIGMGFTVGLCLLYVHNILTDLELLPKPVDDF